MLASMSLASWYREFFPRSPRRSEPGNITAPTCELDPDVQFALGVVCAADKESARDYEQAVRWYRKAAEQGHALAQFNLGIMLSSGQGMSPDTTAALNWTRLSAEGGDAGAQYKLGSRYHRSCVGQLQMDCMESRIEAYKWLKLSAAQGYRGAEAGCERVTLTMTRDEVLDGNQRIASFEVRGSAGSRTASSASTK